MIRNSYVSMAALAANDRTLYQMICGKDNISKNDVMTLFEDIAQVFLKVTLSFMQYGALPEVAWSKYIVVI